MVRFEDSIAIARPPGAVFALLADLEHVDRWQSGIVTSKLVSEGPVRIGTRFTEKMRVVRWKVDTTCEVTEYEPERIFAFHTVSDGRIQYEGRFEIEPLGEGCRLSAKGTASLGGRWRLLEPLMRLDTKRELREELESIKSLVEGETGPGTIAP